MSLSPDSKIFLVTGATAGLGRAAALALAREGLTVVALARDPARGEAVVEEIRAASENSRVELLVGDLASLASVRAAAAELQRRHPRLNVLINNAGVFLGRRMLSPEGLELMFATNHLGPFLLTHLLLDSLTRGAPARVINVTAPSTVMPDFPDLQGERRFSPAAAFGASKAANLLFTYALARRVNAETIMVNAFHPGLVRTGLMRDASGLLGLMSGVLNRFAPDAAVAAGALVQLALSSDFEGVTGQLLHNGRPLQSRFAADTAAQERLWQDSAAMVGIPA